MSTTLSELIAQRSALERQIETARAADKTNAVAQIRKIMTEHGLSVTDLTSPGREVRAKIGKKVAAKYRDPESGATWSGRGLKPKWLAAALDQGRSLKDFAV